MPGLRLWLLRLLWVTSVVLGDGHRPVDFRYAPASDRGRVAVQYVAKGQQATLERPPK